MTQALKISSLINQRNDERAGGFNGEYCCWLIPKSSDQRRMIPIRPVDVSKRGLGFIARQPLVVGTELFLIIGQSRYSIEIAYSDSHLGIENLFRCGLFLREADGDLIEICRRTGLISD